MRASTTFAFIVLTASTVLSSRTAAESELPGSYFLAYQPGVSVQYLALDNSGSNASGFLETVRLASAAPGGESRVQTFSNSGGSSLSFGTNRARRTAQGYTLTTMTQGGNIVELRFVRSTASAINASISALSTRVGRNRIAADRVSGNSQLKDNKTLSAIDVEQLAAGQVAIDAAATLLNAAQVKADRLRTSARQARLAANATIDETGVSLAQNQRRMVAMTIADDAEQAVIIAQHLADLAAMDYHTARAVVVQLRLRIADIAERSRILIARLASEGVTQPTAFKCLAITSQPPN